MRALISYLLRDFFRSHRYFAPAIFYLGIVLWLYTIIPNPVLESYSSTSTLLFAVSGWLTLNFLKSEPAVQGQLTVLHTGGRARYEAARLAACGLVLAGLSLIATFYPALKGAFDHRPTATELVTGLYAHLALSFLMAVFVWLIERDGKGSYLNTFVLLLLLLVLSVGGQGILLWLPDGLRPLAWLLPPVFRVNDALVNIASYSQAEYLTKLLAPVWYGLILLGFGFWRLKKQ